MRHRDLAAAPLKEPCGLREGKGPEDEEVHQEPQEEQGDGKLEEPQEELEEGKGNVQGRGNEGPRGGGGGPQGAGPSLGGLGGPPCSALKEGEGGKLVGYVGVVEGKVDGLNLEVVEEVPNPAEEDTEDAKGVVKGVHKHHSGSQVPGSHAGEGVVGLNVDGQGPQGKGGNDEDEDPVPKRVGRVVLGKREEDVENKEARGEGDANPDLGDRQPRALASRDEVLVGAASLAGSLDKRVAKRGRNDEDQEGLEGDKGGVPGEEEVKVKALRKGGRKAIPGREGVEGSGRGGGGPKKVSRDRGLGSLASEEALGAKGGGSLEKAGPLDAEKAGEDVKGPVEAVKAVLVGSRREVVVQGEVSALAGWHEVGYACLGDHWGSCGGRISV